MKLIRYAKRFYILTNSTVSKRFRRINNKLARVEEVMTIIPVIRRPSLVVTRLPDMEKLRDMAIRRANASVILTVVGTLVSFIILQMLTTVLVSPTSHFCSSVAIVIIKMRDTLYEI